MRLKSEERTFIKNFFAKKGAQVYLFGSRLDDAKKGGDIDLLVDGDVKLADILSFKVEFYKRFGEQKIDVVYRKGAFFDHIRQKAKPL